MCQQLLLALIYWPCIFIKCSGGGAAAESAQKVLPPTTIAWVQACQIICSNNSSLTDLLHHLQTVASFGRHAVGESRHASHSMSKQ